jgi:multidrug efflux pump subunit AcrA (membrane-fusion protein)
MLRRRLIRAKRMIKRLRRERDKALEEREKSATNLHELTGQIERLKSAQRAAAEALGLPPSALPAALPPLSPSPPAAATSFTREFHPADLSGGRVAVGAARNLPAASDGLVSAFGRPRVLGKTTSNTASHSPNYGNVPAFTSRHGSPSVGQSSHPALMTAKSVRQSRRSRRLLVASLCAGTALAGAAFFGVVLPAMFPLSTDAVVNSTVSITRAPIEGLISGLVSKPGETISDGQKLANLRNDRLNLTQLDSLRDDAQATRTRVDALAKDIEQAQAEQATLLAAQTAWRNERVRAYKALLDASRLSERDARAAVDETDARLHGLRLAGVPAAELVEPAVAYERAKRQLASASATITDLETALAATTAGGRDAEWERHGELDQIASRLNDAKTAHAQAGKLLAETEQAITAENNRIEHLRAAEVSSAKGGRVLRLHTADGRWLRSGDLIAAVADPTSIVIDCVVPDRSVDNIALGSEIAAYLITDRKEVHGRVIAKFTPTQGTTDGGDWAEDFVAQHRFRTVVRIGLEGIALDTVQVGQGVRVMFLGSNPGLITRGLAELAQVGRF